MFKVLLPKFLIGAICVFAGEQLGTEFDAHKPDGSFLDRCDGAFFSIGRVTKPFIMYA
jgi:hypothetical protein